MYKSEKLMNEKIVGCGHSNRQLISESHVYANWMLTGTATSFTEHSVGGSYFSLRAIIPCVG